MLHVYMFREVFVWRGVEMPAAEPIGEVERIASGALACVCGGRGGWEVVVWWVVSTCCMCVSLECEGHGACASGGFRGRPPSEVSGRGFQ